MNVRVGVIGTGWSDRVLIPAFQAGGLDVAMVASRDVARAQAVADSHGVDGATGDWRDLLEQDLDLIVVATPPSFHLEQASAVLESGHNLLCEKPLGLDVGEARRVAEIAAAHPEQLALVDHQLRFTPVRRKARELIRSGAIGRNLVISARIANSQCIDPTRPWTWWSDRSQGGGMLRNVGSHVLDSVRWLTGDDVVIHGATLGKVFPTLWDEGQERDVSSDDVASVTFSAGNAVGSMLVHGASLDDAIDIFTIRGTEGSVVIDRSLKLYYGKRGGPLKEFRTSMPSVVPYRFRTAGFDAGCVLLADALRRRFQTGDASVLADAATVFDAVEVHRQLETARHQAVGDAA